ncbi:chemotaxis protein CheA [Photobacterium angustum]|uniref:chemotaxis protein CheA n=1 Tax=Photobacterium angustum TaxID=661 RepID=UPI0005E5D997|nr:chemotaxis protein CheA [Photobacterium angustum]KJG18595.1 chemotaxis protein CheA [Photobacterium angustum]KJG25843.1 chemotaxis protein CheA [Photobacterium angustum]KJG34027.1 chemotaxis protein CheA [Photobacterium angustum]PSW94844.1 chemotaxis protein CheA [Photobacterium angustum]PSX04442.1 chemotaxis protein CheA [Photobacterium angustum]
MSFDLDEDILQDFLIEAGEILELLSEQLVELERSPDDSELLNAIFRGFHTVKGGAGFLSLTELVDACHGAENVFDLLRTGKRSVTSELMDVILEALDCINVMFEQVKEHQPLDRAEQRLLDALHYYSQPATADEIAPISKPVEAPPVDVIAEVTSEPAITSNNENVTTGDSVDDMTQDEFDRLLDELHGAGQSPSKPTTPEPTAQNNVEAQLNFDSGDITDDEFERLLDELHGSGKGPGNSDTSAAGVTTPSSPVTPPSTVPEDTGAGDSDDLMTDDEFERLLDELHGAGKSPSLEEQASAAQSTANDLTEVEAAVSSAQSTPMVTPSAPVSATHQPPAERSAKPVAVKEKSKPQADATVRVDTSTLDTIMNMVGELVLVRNRLVSLGLNTNDEEMSKAVSNLDVVTADLQGAVMKTRMQPIKKVFGRFPRVVRDLARSLKKEIVLEMRGEETDLDKNLVEALADPLVHLVRNSVDHGIEMPDVREQVGKPRTGTVLLSASQEGDHILLTIEDDGGGMDAEKLRSIAVERGVMDADAASRITDNEAYNLIFAPGFSTKKEISDISGRGVGMDVVKTGINQLNGSIHIDSVLGKGTRIDIKVPLTLAILPTLMVGVGEQPFALPLASVNEIFHLDLNKTNTVDGQLTIIVRDKAIPLFYLQDWLSNMTGRTNKDRGHGHVVIVQIGHQRIGFVVDTLIGQEEVVIKPLDSLLQGTPGMAGATITSDGHIALILDVPSLLKHYAGH